MYDFTLVDAHVHPFIKPEKNIALYNYPSTPGEMVAELKKTGVTLCCGSVIQTRWTADFQVVAGCNAEAFEFAEKFPDFLIPGITVHAAFPEKSCAEIEKYYASGKLHWIGELVPYMAGTMDYFSAPELFPVYDLAQQLELPVNFHSVDMYGIPALLKKFPRLAVVIAHPGEKGAYLEKLELMKQFPNLYLDLSGTGLFRWGMLSYGVREAGAEKFLFGSDFPVCSAGMNLGGVLAEGLSKSEYQLIFSGNFRRLTGL